MARLCLLLFLSLAVVVAFVQAATSVGSRLPGDRLLLSEIIHRDLLGKARLKRRFEGYIITRIEVRVIRPLRSFFDLKIISGGVYANFVELSVNLFNIISVRKRVRIYGMKVKPAKCQTCLLGNDEEARYS